MDLWHLNDGILRAALLRAFGKTSYVKARASRNRSRSNRMLSVCTCESCPRERSQLGRTELNNLTNLCSPEEQSPEERLLRGDGRGQRRA